jgi:predicted alpha/beta superfamily hydrolase
VTRSTEAALPDTHVHYLPSAHVGDEFRIVVGSCEGAPAGAGVLVVLDAFYFFGTALETVRLLAMSGHIEPLLVVGVGYRPLTIADTTRLRQRDFTSVVDARAPGDPGMPPGADRFAAFLEEELEPCILARHDVAIHLLLTKAIRLPALRHRQPLVLVRSQGDLRDGGALCERPW